MRLLDQIALGQVAGGAREARRVHDAPLRFIVDEAASRQCFDMVRAGGGLLDPANRLLRLPAERFWLEWLSEAPAGQRANHRLGVLVEGAEDGRSGTITPFWQQDERQAAMAHVRIRFDLDRAMPPDADTHLLRRLRHAGLPGLDALFGHMIVEVDAAWAGVQQRQDPHGSDAAMRAEAEAVWFNLPFTLAFGILLGGGNAVDQRPSDLARLNRARAKRGRPPLLEHLEVRLRLGGTQGGGAGRPGNMVRERARLHLVRGHSVRRGDLVFWRTSHLRGDPSQPIRSKTISVHS